MTEPEKPEPCDRCGREDGQHDYLESDCQLPHSYRKVNHPPQRREGFCCTGCLTRLAEWITEIVELYATLDQVIDPDNMPDEGDTEYQKPRKAPASPSPIRLGAWSLLHGRVKSKVYDDDGVTVLDAYLGGYLPHVPTIMTAWAQAVYDAKNWTDTAPTTVTGAAAVLRGHQDTLAALPDVDTYDAELKWVRRHLRTAHGLAEQRKKVGDCPSLTGDGSQCGGALYPDATGQMAVWCQRCGRRFNEKFLRLLGGMIQAS